MASSSQNDYQVRKRSGREPQTRSDLEMKKQSMVLLRIHVIDDSNH